jgi:hypothetical protein
MPGPGARTCRPPFMCDDNIQLLLAGSTPVASPARGEQVRELLGRRIDWDLLLEQANWHCVSPLLYTVLRAEAPDLAPAAALSSLRSRYELNFRHNLFMTGQMMQLVRKFRERNIPVIAYKGPALCSYYQDLGLREFGDLDFLVAPGDVPRANEMLHLEGFHRCKHQSRSALGPDARLLGTSQSGGGSVGPSAGASRCRGHRDHARPRRYAPPPVRPRRKTYVAEPGLDLRSRSAAACGPRA